MGFRRPLAFIALIGASTPLAMALQTPPAAPAASASAAAPAASAAADAAKAAEAQLTALEATPTKPGDATAGQAKAAACGACHGMDGNSTDPQYPKLADQNPQYIVNQLMRFKSGTRVNAIMQGMASSLSPQDMQDVAAYFSKQARKPGVADPKLTADGGKLYREGDAANGVPACMACHGPDGAGNPGWRVPNIAGQHAQYVETQLKLWHDGTAWGSDAHAKIMPTIAAHLTPADITAVASYVEGLHAADAAKVAAQDKPTD